MSSEELRQKRIDMMRSLMNGVKDGIPEGFGAALFVFTLGQGGEMHYVSSVDRSDMITAIFEFMLANDANLVLQCLERASAEKALETAPPKGQA